MTVNLGNNPFVSKKPYMPEGAKPTMGLRKRDDLNFVIGNIQSVDPDKGVFSVTTEDSKGPRIDISICQPYAGTSSYIMGMPEEHSNVLLAEHGSQLIPICYFPNYINGLDNQNVKVWPDHIKNNDKNEIFMRVRKLQPGEVALASSGGAEVFLGDDLILGDRVGNNQILRSDENVWVSTGIGHYTFDAGVWQASGPAKRNSPTPSSRVVKDPLTKGRVVYVMRPPGSNPGVDPYYTEWLLEVEDTAPGLQPENDVNGQSNTTPRKPIIVMAMGNFIGNNPDSKFYGQLVRPVFFKGPDDRGGQFNLQEVQQKDSDTLGMAYSLFKPARSNPDTGAFFGIDKEGHFWIHAPAATGGGLGKGRSMSILMGGNLKETLGQDTKDGNSWDLNTVGGVRWNLGKHGESADNVTPNRSLDIKASGSIHMASGSVSETLKDIDDDKKDVVDTRAYFSVIKVGGKARHEVNGTRETLVGGDEKIVIAGQKVEVIRKAAAVRVSAAYNVSVGDVYSLTVTKELQEKLGSRATTVTQGSSVLKIESPVGDIKEEITIKGDKSTTIKVGNIIEALGVSSPATLGTGNRIFNTLAGDWVAKTKKGKMELSTTVGDIKVYAGSGNLEYEAWQNITMKTKKSQDVTIEGGTINLKGRAAQSGGVITDKTHKDYITGAYLQGSQSVKATS